MLWVVYNYYYNKSVVVLLSVFHYMVTAVVYKSRNKVFARRFKYRAYCVKT